jgi:23S rRNA (guanosine2251-2'-O)-methyltransferase
MSDSPEYQQKKAFFDQLLTIYGRKPVLEALQDQSLNIYKLHLADSNKEGGIIEQIKTLAAQRHIPIQWHERTALSRISRNSKQDQGVAADIELEKRLSVAQFLQQQPASQPFRLLALDGITNPQNLGMIIRSACAGHIDGLVIPRKSCAALSPLVIKASAGTLFKACLIHCENLQQGLQQLKSHATLCTLSSHAQQSLFDYRPNGSVVYVLGNETDGVSAEINRLADHTLAIPMNNGVESLNVAVTAALIAFHG